MKSQLKFVPVLMLLLAIPAAADEENRAVLSSFYRYEHHRTLGDRHELFFHSDFRINDFVSMGGGFSTAFKALPERMTVTASVENLPSFLKYNLTFLTRDFPDYGIQETSLFPTIALMTRFLEFELGCSFRWVRYVDLSYSSHTLYRLQLNVLNLDHWELFYRASNFDSFRADNVTTLYHILGNRFRINENWVITADFGLHDAGQVAFSSYLTAFHAELGFRYRI